MTPAQLRAWFLQQFDPEDAAFNLHRVRLLTGPLDPAALEKAVTALARRHETLRTRFPAVDGRPVLVVEPAEPVEVEWLRASSAEEAEALVAARTNRPFDLVGDLPFRVSVVGLGPESHVLVVVVHHIICDGWSLDVLMDDLAVFYGGGEPEPLQITAREHAEQTPEIDPKELAYWRERLADPPTLELPADRPRPAERVGRGDETAFRIPASLVSRLSEVARGSRCTLFALLLAAYQVLLSRHSGQDDVTVGVPDGGRDTEETHALVAGLSGMLVLRGDLSGDPPFQKFLRGTMASLLGALSRRRVPFERLVEELDIGRDLSVTPFYQTTLTLHPGELEREQHFSGLTATPFPHGWKWVRCDVAVDVFWAGDDSGDLVTVVRYDTDLFDEPTVTALFERFRVLLRGIADDPALPISRLPLMTDDERDRLVTTWNATGRPVPAPLPRLFAEQAARTPDAIAFSDGEHVLTYAELDQAAGRIAGRLGDRRGSVVAVCVDRSVRVLPALLGVMRSGAAYLPIDPDNPPARIQYMLEDSGAALVLADEGPAERLPADVKVVTVSEALAADPSDRFPPGPGDHAYTLYTSGSTGRPKGVVIRHSALANFLAGMADLLGSDPGQVWLVLSSVSFDISALELYLPLVGGGRAVIAGRDVAVDGAAQIKLIEDAGVTHIQSTPSGWRVLIEAGFADPEITGLVGGEALPEELSRELRPRLGRLVNVYGPTETTIWSTTWEVPPGGGEPRIGRPIANTTCYVADRAGGVAPTFVAGELLIGGAGLADGYHGRPELTAERFVEFAGERVYRTGDRARWGFDGNLEFLGRMDNQVKVRGFRVEPGEVEAAILTCPGVDQAAVTARGDILVGYIVGDADLGDLRDHLEKILPAYMMPALWTRLGSMPMTISGKVDRKALPDPVAESGAEFVEPRTDAERLVADIWQEVLGLDRIGALDDFFAVGGHSLIAVRVAARIRAIIDLDVPIRYLFLRRTVEELARTIEDLLAEEFDELTDEEAARLVD
uniref:non-ribosomal peptide synthetase n=1 Tax=Herbidospora sakaeratensis TaxID=564415 RepID=UPI0007866709|nr:non-ribosomal peptide synthetase [Herbidospora sakaeratensis]